MSISLLETRVKIYDLINKIREYEDELEKSKDEEIEKKIKELNNEIEKFENLIENGECIYDIPDYEDNRVGCKYCSGCIYCQDIIEFDIADEF